MDNITHCRDWEGRVAQWADGAGDAQTAAHVASCAGCAKLGAELRAMTVALHALPVRQPSAMFDAKLAGRLAVLEDAKRSRPWWQALGDGWRRAARPALALGACAAAVVGIAVVQHPVANVVPLRTGPVASDNTLLLHCVAQHRTDVSAQPLSDPAAQNLAAQMDDAATGTAADASPGEDSL